MAGRNRGLALAAGLDDRRHSPDLCRCSARRARTCDSACAAAEAIAVGRALRLQQTWDMFAPDPPKATSREEIHKTLSDGSVVIEPASTSFRWAVYVGRVGSQQSRGSPLSSSMSRFALYRCGDTAPGDGVRVERLAILSHQRQIYADGPDEPVTRTLIEVQCPAAQSAVHPEVARIDPAARSAATSRRRRAASRRPGTRPTRNR